jgi:hypothetical protein
MLHFILRLIQDAYQRIIRHQKETMDPASRYSKPWHKEGR